MRAKIRNILRNFYNESNRKTGISIPHAGNDPNCTLCKIEEKAIQKLMKLKGVRK